MYKTKKKEKQRKQNRNYWKSSDPLRGGGLDLYHPESPYLAE